MQKKKKKNMHRPGSSWTQIGQEPSWTAAEEEWLPLVDRNRGASIFTCNRKQRHLGVDNGAKGHMMLML